MKVICETYDSPKFGSLTLYMQEHFPTATLKETEHLKSFYIYIGVESGCLKQ